MSVTFGCLVVIWRLEKLDRFGLIIFSWLLATLTGLSVLISLILFIGTFIKAFHALHSNSTNHRVSKKQFRLTGLFFIMFLVFAIVYTPLTILGGHVVRSLVKRIVPEILLTVTLLPSTLNPALTLIFNKQFRIHKSRAHININRNNMATRIKILAKSFNFSPS